MKEIISKEEARRLMNINGKIRGVALKTEAEFIIKENGEKELKRLEEEIAKTGYQIEYKKINPMDFYPIGMMGITLLGIKNVFNFSEEKFIEMGKCEAKVSLIVRLFMKYFVSTSKLIDESPKMWRKYHTIGNLSVTEFDKEKKQAVLKLENFEVISLHCLALKGYFSSIFQMVVKGSPICEEKKCVYREDAYHEFLLKW